MTEQEFQRRVIEAALLYGWRVHHCRPAMRRDGRWSTPIEGSAGFVDLVLARGGVVMFWELKSERGSLSPQQRAWRDQIGWAWTCWRPADWPAVLSALQQVSA